MKIKKFSYPYDYLVSDGFLSQSILNNILSKKKNFFEISENVQEKLKNKKISHERNILRFIEKDKILIKKNEKSLIKLSTEIKKLLKKKINKKFYKSLNISPKLISKGTYNISICWDKPGYSAIPHTDTDRKIWSGIIYLFGNGRLSGGTSVLIKKQKKFKSFKEIKPKINKLFAFKRTDKSYHSVKRSNKKRLILLINFNYKNDFYEKKKSR